MTLEEIDKALDKRLAQDLKDITPHQAVQLKIVLSEFWTAKMQRTTAAPLGSDSKAFEIVHVTPDDKRISEN